jgi:hypothetical protein
MKAKILAACAVMAASSSVAIAQEIWGDAGVTLGYYTEPDFDYSEAYLEAWGRALFRFENGVNLQVGGFGGHDFEQDFSYGGLNSDVFYNNGAYAAGIYAGLYADNDDPNAYTNYFAGAQGVVFFSMVDVGAWAGWESNDGDDNADVGAWLAAYVTPNTSVGTNLFWNGNDNFDLYGVTLFAEHRFAGTQWSIWANGRFRHFSGFGVDVDSWNTNVGVTYFFDPSGTTLQEHYRVMPF